MGVHSRVVLPLEETLGGKGTGVTGMLNSDAISPEA